MTGVVSTFFPLKTNCFHEVGACDFGFVHNALGIFFVCTHIIKISNKQQNINK